VTELSTSQRLRGPSVARQPRLAGSALRWALLGVWVVSLAIETTANEQNNARLTRLQQHGIATHITIRSCIGNLGGSGSTGAGFTCSGSFQVAGIHKVATVNGLSTFESPGATVIGVIDPSNLDYVATTSSVAASHTTAPPVAVTSALGLLIAASGFDILRRRRTHR